MLRIFFGLGMLALVSACATLDEGECLSANWYEIGLQDGSNGKSASHFSRHVKACQKHGVIPQQSPWREGREAGLRLFCVPDRAYQVGRNGNSFPGVCNPAETVEMRPAYDWGREYYLIGQEIAELEAEIDNRNDILDDLVDMGSR